MTNLPTPDKNGEYYPSAEDIKNAETVNLREVDPLAGLSDWIKHPKNFMVVEKALLATLQCPKSHSDPLEMTKCTRCSENMLTRRELMKKFGFKDSGQYMAWKKTHQEIIKLLSEEDYEKTVRA